MKVECNGEHELSPNDKRELVFFVDRMAEWQVFATVTFARRRGLFEASSAYLRFMDQHVRQVTHFWAVERNPSGDGGHHVHALWAGTEGLYRRAVWKRAFEQLGRTRIEPIKSNTDVMSYCTKYVVKAGALIDWRIRNQELFNRLQRFGGE